jgi:calcium binding protein 39
MNAFFWPRRKPSKEIVLKVDELLTRLFPDEDFEDALAPKSGGANRESGESIAPVVDTTEECKPRARIESMDAAETDDADADADANGHHVSHDDASEQSGEEEPREKSIPEELEHLWAKIRSIFQAWDEDQVERERKMNRMAELLLRFRVLEKTLLPKVLMAMTFETRKYVGHVFRALTVHGFQNFIEYVGDRPEIIRWLVEGYKNNSTALICGSMLRDCLDHQVLTTMFLKDMPSELEVLFKVTKTNANFDVSADAFRNITKVLRGHKQATLETLSESFDRIFGLLNSLLESTNYVTKRQTLQLLGELLLDPINFSVMQRYVASRANLKLLMLQLRETSQAIRMEAYNVFKIFVANPNKSPEVEQVLVRNREKLLAFVCELGKNETSREFHHEKSLVVYSLQRLAGGAVAAVVDKPVNADALSSATSPASPTPQLALRKNVPEVSARQK